MSDWALAGLVLAMFIAGFNIGQDFKYKKWIFRKKRTYKYYISGLYSIAGTIIFKSWTSISDSEMTSALIKEIKEKISDISENKLAKDDELKKIALKIMEKYEKTFEVLAKWLYYLKNKF